MVWEQGSATIVMLTNLEEKGNDTQLRKFIATYTQHLNFSQGHGCFVCVCVFIIFIIIRA